MNSCGGVWSAHAVVLSTWRGICSSVLWQPIMKWRWFNNVSLKSRAILTFGGRGQHMKLWTCSRWSKGNLWWNLPPKSCAETRDWIRRLDLQYNAGPTDLFRQTSWFMSVAPLGTPTSGTEYEHSKGISWPVLGSMLSILPLLAPHS